jgi:hypothetical protein
MKMSEIGSVESRLEYKSDQTKLETNKLNLLFFFLQASLNLFKLRLLLNKEQLNQENKIE